MNPSRASSLYNPGTQMQTLPRDENGNCLGLLPYDNYGWNHDLDNLGSSIPLLQNYSPYV